MGCGFGESGVVESVYFEVLPEIMKKIQTSEKKKEFCEFVAESIARCAKLMSAGEEVRAANEYKITIKYLKKQFNI